MWSRLDSLTIHQLRVFCAVARLLSYTRAAEELGCQQPTVSALVAELERATQLTLLEQWGRQLALTDEGRELYTHAQEVIAAADEARRSMEEAAPVAGEIAKGVPLRVAGDTTVGTYVLPSLMGVFHQRRPDVVLNLRVANRAAVRAALLAGEVDLAIAGRPPAVDGLVVEPFCYCVTRACVSRTEPDSAGTVGRRGVSDARGGIGNTGGSGGVVRGMGDTTSDWDGAWTC